MKYSKEIIKEIANYLRAGNTAKDACALADITEETYYKWKKRKPEFTESLKKAELECKARNIAIIQKAAEKTWQAAAWWLERKYHDEFALKEIKELGNKDGEVLSIKLDIPNAGSNIQFTSPVPEQTTGSMD